MVFKECLDGFPFGVAKYRSPQSGLVRLFTEADIRSMLANPDHDFPDYQIFSEPELIKGLGAVKKYKAPLYLPRWEWHR